MLPGYFIPNLLVYPHMSLQVGQEQGTCPEAGGSEQSLPSQQSCYKFRAFAFQLPAPKNKNTKDIRPLRQHREYNFPKPRSKILGICNGF